MSLSIHSQKFLLDENVHHALYVFLQQKKVDVILAPKSASDQKLASLSKTQKRIVVTNDEDFSKYSKENIFSVVWLRISQNDPKALIASFEKLLQEVNSFSARLVILKPKTWDIFQLGEDILI